MKILVYEPNKEAYEKEIDGSLESMQKMVGGYIETISIGMNFLIVCNEEGLLLNLEPNRGLVGTFFICKSEAPEMVGLTDAEIELIMHKIK